ncbi:hypothetical protein FRC17_001545 [Serendipita sp. 399]|nr:hypothetical protein FRC17_001545 [Serendipita sp. 399]
MALLEPPTRRDCISPRIGKAGSNVVQEETGGDGNGSKSTGSTSGSSASAGGVHDPTAPLPTNTNTTSDAVPSTSPPALVQARPGRGILARARRRGREVMTTIQRLLQPSPSAAVPDPIPSQNGQAGAGGAGGAGAGMGEGAEGAAARGWRKKFTRRFRK